MHIELDKNQASIAHKLVERGRYASVEEAVLAGLHHIDIMSDMLSAHQAESLREAIEEGIADKQAGRLVPAEEAYARIQQRLAERT